jgi:hypothetical protein
MMLRPGRHATDSGKKNIAMSSFLVVRAQRLVGPLVGQTDPETATDPDITG